MTKWTGNIVINGDANEGTSGWESMSVTVEAIGTKKYFRLQNGRMKQSFNTEEWINGVQQVRLSFLARVNESVTDLQVQSMAKIKFYIENGGVETAYSPIESIDFETFEVVHDINKRKVTQIDIEIKGADLFITDIACEKAFGIDEGIADYINSQMPVYLHAVNNSYLLIDNFGIRPIRIVFENYESTDLIVGLTVVGAYFSEESVTTDIGILFLLDGEYITPGVYQTCLNGLNTISATFLIPQISPGTKSFSVEVYTSGDGETFVIPKEHMRLFLMGSNLKKVNDEDIK